MNEKKWQAAAFLEAVKVVGGMVLLAPLAIPAALINGSEWVKKTLAERKIRRAVEDFETPGGAQRWLARTDKEPVIHAHLEVMASLRQSMTQNAKAEIQVNLKQLVGHPKIHACLVGCMQNVESELASRLGFCDDPEKDGLQKSLAFITGPLHKDMTQWFLSQFIDASGHDIKPKLHTQKNYQENLQAWDSLRLLIDMVVHPKLDDGQTPQQRLATWLEDLSLFQLKWLASKDQKIPIFHQAEMREILIAIFERKLLSQSVLASASSHFVVERTPGFSQKEPLKEGIEKGPTGENELMDFEAQQWQDRSVPSSSSSSSSQDNNVGDHAEVKASNVRRL